MHMSAKIFFVISTLALGATEGLRVWWFSRNQANAESQGFLDWSPPEGAINQNFSSTDGAKLLNQDRGLQYLIEGSEKDLSVEVVYLEYEQGNDRSLADLGSHSPEVCFAATGAKLIKELPIEGQIVKGKEIFIRQWLFENPLSKERFYVFKLVWSPGATHYEEVFKHSGSSPVPLESKLRRAKLSAAWQGLDSPATRVILAMVRGAEDYSVAWKTFKEETIDRLSQTH